jgi:glutamyl-tRNA synthetase
VTMNITLVARGRDHMVNTPPQILLYRALDAAVPELAHLPMMLAPSGEKLSKRHGVVSVTEYRDRGYSPEAVLDYLSRFGWSSGAEELRLTRSELIAAFAWKPSREDGKFDATKFLAVNHHHLKDPRFVPEDAYVRHVLPFVHQRGLAHVTEADVVRALPAVRERAQTFVQAADLLDPFFRDPPVMDDKAAAKFLVGEAAPKLRDLGTLLAGEADWSVATLEARVQAWLGERGMAMKDIGQPARVALTGRSASPSIFEVLAILGRDTALARLSAAAAIAETRAPQA